MTETLRDRVLAAFDLTPDQKDAVTERLRDVAVTAGAGSGKTRTLVARYASLLADGIDMRRVVAITFSDKAALEMRSRVRETLDKLLKKATSAGEMETWARLNAGMDAARISTIHSLCSEILRAHPVEAVVDPRFDVLEESLQVALRLQVVEDTLTELVGLSEFEPLFRIIETDALSNLLAFLLNKRLDVQEAFLEDIRVDEVISRELKARMQSPVIADCIASLRGFGERELYADAGDKLAHQVETLLRLWEKAESALAFGDYMGCIDFLFSARKDAMGLKYGARSSEVKALVKLLRDEFDELLGFACDGDDPPSRETEADFTMALDLIKLAFERLTGHYRDAMRERGALDFDDLEDGAARLLARPEIRELWQGQIDALLVDEFQDTNKRQFAIVQALSGSPGKLFVVGDAKQSIYRFRRADVTVFRSIQAQTKARKGLPIDLKETFRAHAALLEVMGDLLRPIMGVEDDPSRPYYVPFTPMVAHKQSPEQGIQGPHAEFVYGTGEKAKKARPNAARALATRLLELRTQEQVRSWDDVTLLCRASSGFSAYENAFEEANIPFVTVAGRGFYDRAEIRDVLNILRALADPSDDLAMAGLLRSPAFGVTDTALYQLRQQSTPPAHYWAALHDDLSILNEEDQVRASRTLSILDSLLPLVDRVPVAELLKKLVDVTDYRSILAIGDLSGAGGRLWRNLDKLVADARDSGIVNVRVFLDYLTTINDAGAREGEAPAEAQGSVRLMTIHKAKGLEYPVVVLADASHAGNKRSVPAYLLPGLGLAFKLDPEPLLYRLAKKLDKMQDEAETQRVLYVALTRAQQKLIISGHAKSTKKQGWKADGWMADLGDVAGVDLNAVVDQAGSECITRTESGQTVRAWALPPEQGGSKSAETRKKEEVPESSAAPLYAPLMESPAPIIQEDEGNEFHDWRATGIKPTVPPRALGNMAHKAIELWLFPEDARLQPLLEMTALNEGLADESQRKAAVAEVVELLGRLQAHPMRTEIEAAEQVYHELPYSRMAGDRAETGYIDLLYQDAAGWQIVDFKTDAIYTEDHREELAAQYARQMRRYAEVVEGMLGETVRVRLCFLDDRGRVGVVESN